MPIVVVDDVALTVRLSIPEHLMALRPRDVIVPRAAVRRCFSVSDPWPLLRGLRWPGLGLPGVVALGTWRWRSPAGTGRDFVSLIGRGHGVVVDLAGHEFDRLLLTVREPAELTSLL